MITNPPISTPPILELSQRTFTRLLLLYPREYRQEYGPLMAQLFKDCSREAIGQNGGAALLALWSSTLFDLFKTAFEEHVKELTHMSKEKFIRLGGWALMIGAIFLILVITVGNLETSFDDPLGGRDAWVEYLKLGVGPLGMLLLLTGTLALRSAYGQVGRAALSVSAVAAFAAAVGALGLGLLIPGDGVSWSLFFLGTVIHFFGLGVFAVNCVQRNVMPGVNWLLVLGGFALPALGLFQIAIQLITGTDFYLGEWVQISILGITAFSLLVVGYQLQRGPMPIAKAATR
jgi:hypothetical protein